MGRVLRLSVSGRPASPKEESQDLGNGAQMEEGTMITLS
jgi:hypothetical protein